MYTTCFELSIFGNCSYLHVSNVAVRTYRLALHGGRPIRISCISRGAQLGGRTGVQPNCQIPALQLQNFTCSFGMHMVHAVLQTYASDPFTLFFLPKHEHGSK